MNISWMKAINRLKIIYIFILHQGEGGSSLTVLRQIGKSATFYFNPWNKDFKTKFREKKGLTTH